MAGEFQKHFGNNSICRLCGKEILVDKVRDHCHFTKNYRGQVHFKCIRNLKQKQSNFIPVVFHNFSNCDCHLFLKNLVDKEMKK